MLNTAFNIVLFVFVGRSWQASRVSGRPDRDRDRERDRDGDREKSGGRQEHDEDGWTTVRR